MSRNRPLTEAELQYIGDHLSDEEYCLSEFDGDEDADDNFPGTSSIFRTPSQSSTTSIDSQPKCSSTSVQHLKRVRQCTLTRNTNNSSGNEDFDDSDQDPDFDPDDGFGFKHNKLVFLINDA
ncbi:uncharacterized protein LOC126880048 [Diabrotica virgifera virgifera]|uniref:Uncharacterized protein n=1 Tax=Diabrotica virgifera virgifera TaxID=50390 RepID=A0ABM5JNX6_DIAVI|nr:uncharacterized protein LOC126880048 [Diabrotica virgifera virgifera]